MSIQLGNELLHASGVNPKVQLEGTETSAKNLSIRENAGVIEVYDETSGTVVMTLENHSARHKQGGADEVVGIALFDTAANRPAAGTANRFFLATNTWELSQDDGSAWQTIGTLGGLSLPSHQARHIAGGADALSGLTKAQMAADTAQWAIIIPIISETPRTGLTADATGNKWASINIIPQAAEIDCLKGAYVEATWTATATDSVTQIEIYDTTAAASLVSVSGNAGTDVRSSAATLTAGNTINVKVNVTTASATGGATTDVTKALLILQMGIS